jgi:hypothetical protein
LEIKHAGRIPLLGKGSRRDDPDDGLVAVDPFDILEVSDPLEDLSPNPAAIAQRMPTSSIGST